MFQDILLLFQSIIVDLILLFTAWVFVLDKTRSDNADLVLWESDGVIVWDIIMQACY